MYVIGVDFGTLSGRAILVDAQTGAVAAQEEMAYPHGVMTQLPGHSPLGAGWALQDPMDYLAVLESTIPALLCQADLPPEQVAALAWDVTSCTMLPIRSDGTPLCCTEQYRGCPHAYVKLWKHHAAQPQADRLEALIQAESPALLDRYGGRVSSQWMFPKALQILEEAPELYQSCDLLLEVNDWLTLQLTGRLTRSSCFAGFKSLWDPQRGYPPSGLLKKLDVRLADLIPKKLGGRLAAPWEPAGQLTALWAERLHLTPDTVIAAGIIDAHAGVLGSGITEAGTLLMIMGTSTCHILLSPRQTPVPGICGSCRDSILPGFYAYEAGQACVGDVLDWFVHNSAPASITAQAEARRISAHALLSEQAGLLAPGESGLLALDWWNGQRTPLVDNRLTGLMLGMTLRTTPADQYRALMESTAYGTRMILDTFEQAGMETANLAACGGIVRKNSLMMQIYADVLERPIRAASSNQSPALGAAILAASAAGLHKTTTYAVRAMTRPGETIYRPNPAHSAAYRTLYQEYRTLSAYFGQGGHDGMKNLLRLAETTAHPHRP